jgi:hypothetical protein
METEGSLPYSQKPATEIHTERGESSPHYLKLYLNDPF